MSEKDCSTHQEVINYIRDLSRQRQLTATEIGHIFVSQTNETYKVCAEEMNNLRNFQLSLLGDITQVMDVLVFLENNHIFDTTTQND